MAAEIRYVGTRGVDQWSELNYNERDLLGNGFYDEFKLAVANLQANKKLRVFRCRHRHQPTADLSRISEWDHQRGQRRGLLRIQLEEHGADRRHGSEQSVAG
jgi:hypothetical protein